MITKIVSGGQTGADRGGLDAAIYCRIPYDGWMPKGRLAEDGVVPEKYRLKEMRSKDYLKRTEQNVIDSDCTLVFTYGNPSRGTKRTIEFAGKHERSCHISDLKGAESKDLVDHICKWLVGEIEEEEYPPPPRHPVLNVAGPRESKVTGIQNKVAAIMVQVLIRTNPDCRNLYPIAEGGVNLELALEIARIHVKPALDEDVEPWPDPPMVQPCIYGKPTDPNWVIRAPWNDGKDGTMLRSSRVILISKLTGEILHDGEANDEG
ncbi:putative molybdenum carrier protein [Kiritimatiellota bacterium B12222]|nr:putative molybdenum carrier protein [Kiritimatiellota bacterium B12222]